MTTRKRQEIIVKGVAIAVLRRGIQVAGILLAILLAIHLYYTLAPGSWFLRSSDITVQSSTLGQNIPFDWCRSPLEGTIHATALRTFYKKQPDASFKTVSEYTFEAGIEPINTKCQPLTINKDRQPQEGGTYYFVTDLTWYQNGYEKKLRYTSNQYQIFDSVAALLKLYRDQQKENEILRQRLLELGVNPEELTFNTSPVKAKQMPSTSTQNIPTTSAPPDPTPTDGDAKQPRQTGLVQGTINTLDKTVNDVLNLLPIGVNK